MKIRLSMQGASLNVEVSDKKAMGIYRGLAEKEDSLGEDSFRIRDTRPGKNNGRIYPYYPDAKYRIDVHVGEEVDREKEN